MAAARRGRFMYCSSCPSAKRSSSEPSPSYPSSPSSPLAARRQGAPPARGWARLQVCDVLAL
eukprot:1275765-Prymnesium_polylepis.1